MREVKGSDTDNQYLTRLKERVNMRTFAHCLKDIVFFPRKISCITIVSYFSWVLQPFRDKIEEDA